MKINLLLVFLCTFILSTKAQDFIESPYQDLTMSSPIVADFDGDGKLDVFGNQLYFNNPNEIVLLINGGTTPIGFSEKDLNLSFDAYGSPAVADFDMDGDMDIVIAKGENHHLFILQNDGTANFSADSLGVSGAAEIKTADIDNDNDTDIIGINTENNTLDIYINDGNQNFTKTNLTTSSNNLAVFDIGDLDNDNDVDILLGFDEFLGAQIVLYKNNGGNNFEEMTLVSSEFNGIRGIIIDDFNNDDTNDFIAIKGFSCAVWKSQGGLTFEQQNIITSSGIINNFVVGDYNGDGLKDILLGYNSSDITWHKNLSNTTLEFESATVGGVSPVYSIVNADLDDDNDTDIVLSNGEFWWYENNIVQEPVSILEFTEEAISVFPNPCTTHIFVKSHWQNKYKVQVFDRRGNILLENMLSTDLVDLSHLPQGGYILSLTNLATEQSRSTQIIKVK